MINIKTFTAIALCALLFAGPAHAQDSNPGVDILPAKSVTDGSLYVNLNEDTHPPLRLTPDKSELVRLDKDAGTVIVGNPEHLSVMADSARTLVLVPRAAGATYVTILDLHGEVLMQRHVIVASPKEKYVRIRRSCANSESANCRATQVYFCPDMCHEIAMPQSAAEQTQQDTSIEGKIKDVASDIKEAAGTETEDAGQEQ